MDLASDCRKRQVIKFFRFQDELVEWCNKCFETKSICTSPNTNAIDFGTLYDELGYTTSLFNRSYSDVD